MRKNKACFGFFLCIVTHFTSAQVVVDNNFFIYHQMTAPSRSHTDLLAHLENCSLLPYLSQKKITVYSENKFMLKELQSFNINLAIPGNNISYDITGKYTGLMTLKNHEISFAVAKKIDPRLSIGLKWRFTKILIPNHESVKQFSGSISMVILPVEKLSIGASADNVISYVERHQGSENLKGVYKIGVGLDCTKEFYIGFKIVKNAGNNFQAMAAMHYQFGASAKVRFGINFFTLTNEIGIDLSIRRIALMIDVNYHPQLGPSSFLAFQNNTD